DFPGPIRARFGEPGRLWIDEMIGGVIEGSLRTGTVSMDPDTLATMQALRAFMFERVYLDVATADQRRAAVGIIRDLVDWHLDHPGELPISYREADATLVVQVVDYVAGMTDRFAQTTHDHIFGA
ncbi:MAG: HD domain-containing protein, partial [Candidatus Limnocylindrales bacterium]